MKPLAPKPPTFWALPGLLIIYGRALDADAHKHQAIQLVLGDASCSTTTESLLGSVLINSQVEHKLLMDQGWLLLIEPKSALGKGLQAQLLGRDVCALQWPPSSQLPELPVPQAEDDPLRLLAPFFEAMFKLGLQADLQDLKLSAQPQVDDPRIARLLEKLNACPRGQCLKPTGWKAADVAAELALSEGRFLHLFKQELGLPWRPFLLWYRLLCAIQAMLQGNSATEAAYLAGFSDSAHLSRTFRNLFGLSIRDAQAIFSQP